MMITVQLEPDGPITEMDERDLVCTRGGIDNEVECTTWVEYRLRSAADGRVVHRSVDMRLKQAVVFSSGESGKF